MNQQPRAAVEQRAEEPLHATHEQQGNRTDTRPPPRPTTAKEDYS